MPDLQTPPNQQRPDTPATAGGADDPLTHLHKMSRTAGLGSTDYVAINAPSVLAVILGLASALAIVDKILLIVPIAGVICSIVAMYQIGRSAGTQTGKGLAVVGLLLSLGFVGFVGYQSYAAARQAKADRDAIEAMLVQLTGNLQKNEINEAYALFSPRFTERVQLPQFTNQMKFVQDGSLGKIQTITTNGLYDFSVDPGTGIRRGAVILIMKFDKSPDPARLDAAFRNVGGQWKIENIPALFPAPQQGG